MPPRNRPPLDRKSADCIGSAPFADRYGGIAVLRRRAALGIWLGTAAAPAALGVYANVDGTARVTQISDTKARIVLVLRAKG